MDAIQLMLSLFLNAMLMCSAGPATDRQLNGILYQVIAYDCAQPEVKHFEVWSRRCLNEDTQATYQARPFLLEEAVSHVGFYLNEFGEVHASTTGGLHANDLYVPRCGV